MGDNRPPVYYETIDGRETLIIRASSIGNPCLLDLTAAGQGHPPSPLPKVLVKAFDDGTNLESVVIDKLVEEYGVTPLETQHEYHLYITDDIVVRFHPDLVGHPNRAWMERRNGVVVFEVKALSDGLYKQAVRNGVSSTIDEYPWQLSVMMLGKGLPGVWVVYNKETGEIYLERHSYPLIDFDTIAAKALRIKELVDGEDILTSGLTCNSPDHWPCRYLHLRTQDSTSLPDNHGKSSDVLIADEDRDKFDKLVKQYQYYKGQEDENSKRRKEALNQILELTGNRKVKVKSDKWEVPVYEGHGSKSYDWASMPEELKEELKKYEKEGKTYWYVSNVKRLD